MVDDEGFQQRAKPARRPRPPPIIGTGQRNRLRVVKEVRRCDLFVSRLAPDTTEDDIAKIVEDATGEKPLHVLKLRTRHPSYASFHVTAADAHRDALLCTEAWDGGTLVRSYFVQRMKNSRANNNDMVSNSGDKGVDRQSSD